MPAYESFGDTLPPVEDLLVIVESGQLQAVNMLLPKFIASEACLDLATAEPDEAEKWLRQAGQFQSEIERLTTQGLGAKSRQFVANQRDLMATTYIRQAEMPHWQRAVHGQPLENQYEPLLRAAERVLTLINPDVQPPQNDKAYSKLLEFMPILLGARALQRLTGDGWFGRMSLSREQARPLDEATENSNWDSCIIFDNSAADFLIPTLRLSVKSQFRRGRGKSRRNARKSPSSFVKAGVLPVSAQMGGFGNPWQIIASCLQEFESIPPSLPDEVSLLAPEQLDLMTGDLRRSLVRRHAKLISGKASGSCE